MVQLWAGPEMALQEWLIDKSLSLVDLEKGRVRNDPAFIFGSLPYACFQSIIFNHEDWLVVKVHSSTNFQIHVTKMVELRKDESLEV